MGRSSCARFVLRASGRQWSRSVCQPSAPCLCQLRPRDWSGVFEHTNQSAFSQIRCGRRVSNVKNASRAVIKWNAHAHPDFAPSAWGTGTSVSDLVELLTVSVRFISIFPIIGHCPPTSTPPPPPHPPVGIFFPLLGVGYLCSM